MPAVSVILPIYNAEPFLAECLDSIRNQTCTDIEVLCVNDGSTDSSLETIQKFAKEDSRFVVLSKPNGGYGHSLNYGLERARGDYISIVEPDDFIDPGMYEGLLGFAEANGHKADIIKGSYWEYFDESDEFGEVLRRPTLVREMKQTPYSFVLSDDAEVFAHHPSIWSALYRREFLESNAIRFVEPKGAGWADNPFLAETLVKAKEIVWVPNGYYYYRQTNPGASSFLKDYHVPFDRLRDMRRVLSSAGANGEIWSAFYRREFDYIRSTINEFGFHENDPEVYELIHEVLTSLDRSILYGSRFVRPEDLLYYEHFLKEYNPSALTGGVACDASGEGEGASFDASFIVPFKHHALRLSECVESLLNCGISSCEVICVNCGSDDRSVVACVHLAGEHENVSVLGDDYQTFAEGINAALRKVRGKCFMVFGPSCHVEGGLLARTVARFLRSDSDVVVVDADKRFVAPLMTLSGTSQIVGKDGEVILDDMESQAMAPCLLNLIHVYQASNLCKTRFAREHAVEVFPGDCLAAPTLACRALASAEKVSYVAGSCFKDEDRRTSLVPFFPDLHESLVTEKPPVFPSLNALLSDEAFSGEELRQSKANLLVAAFMDDVASRRFPETLQLYVETHLGEAKKACVGVEGREFFDVEQYYDFQVLERKGLEVYLATQYLYKSNDVKFFQKSIEDLVSSRRFRIGARLADALGGSFVGRLRTIVRKR